MNIDWDQVGQDADDSPRSILAEVLGRADEIKELVVLFQDETGVQHEYVNVSSGNVQIAMLELSKWDAIRNAHKAVGEE